MRKPRLSRAGLLFLLLFFTSIFAGESEAYLAGNPTQETHAMILRTLSPELLFEKALGRFSAGCRRISPSFSLAAKILVARNRVICRSCRRVPIL